MPIIEQFILVLAGTVLGLSVALLIISTPRKERK